MGSGSGSFVQVQRMPGISNARRKIFTTKASRIQRKPQESVVFPLCLRAFVVKSVLRFRFERWPYLGLTLQFTPEAFAFIQAFHPNSMQWLSTVVTEPVPDTRWRRMWLWWATICEADSVSWSTVVWASDARMAA